MRCRENRSAGGTGADLGNAIAVLDDRQVLASEIGWEGERDHTGKALYSPLRELPLDHDAMQRIQNEDCFVIEDARADWRFKQNVRAFLPASAERELTRLQPYAREGGSITFVSHRAATSAHR